MPKRDKNTKNVYTVTEEELDFFVRFPERLSQERRKAIEAYVKNNTFAADYVARQKKFYAELDSELNEQPTEHETALADRFLRKRQLFLPPLGLTRSEKKEISEPWFEVIGERRTLSVRFVQYVRRYPVRTTGFASIIAAAVFMLATLVQPKIDSNPVYAKLTNYVLRVYNSEGAQLWTKSMLGYAGDSSFTSTPYHQTLLVADIDGDGKNEVLIAAGNNAEITWDDTLKCFNYDGALRWKRTVGAPVLFGGRHSSKNMTWQYTSIFTFSDSAIETADRSASKPRLFGTAGSEYLPSKLFEMDPLTGKDLQAYWVPGGINAALPMDIDNDGKEELLVGGNNDAWNRAFLAVLDPSNINGHAPVCGDYVPENCPPAHEKYYLLFPFTEYGQLLSPKVSTNYTTRLIAQNNGAFTAVIQEVFGDRDSKYEGTIHYTISPTMKIHLLFDDPFVKGHEVLEREGKLKDKIGDEYANKLIHEILFWDGEKFVDHPTMNKLYSPLMKAKTGNPTFAEVKNNVLTVYGESGEELWTKPDIGMDDYNMNNSFFAVPPRPFLIADVDGDGTNEVLANLYNRKYLSNGSSNTLVCYSSDGSERWRYTFSLDLSGVENGRMTATKTQIQDFAVIPGDSITKPRIFAVICDPSPYPSCIVEIDPIHQTELQHYWHVGQIQKLLPADVDGDGKEELLFAGVNNFENAAFVSALEPDNISGQTSVAFNGFMKVPRVQEMFYCLFPPTKLCLLQDKYNSVNRIEPLEGGNVFRVDTREVSSQDMRDDQGIIYALNRQLKVVSIVPYSSFQKAYDEARKAGHPELEPLGAAYYEKLKHSVRYWDGEKFVNTPTFNKKYAAHQLKTPLEPLP
ncbi:MAG: hypothetical protein KGJ59_14240 [Bacteroidota bacterium]|nr:hypothetical protein [Bacteroidota bacterium]